MMLKKGFLPMSLLYQINRRINDICLDKTLDSVMNPIAKDIVLRADVYLKPALLILAVSLLRFSDAENFLLFNPMLPHSKTITQGKTKRPVTLNFSMLPIELRAQISELSKKYEVFNYVSIRNYLRNYNINNLRCCSLHFSNKAHLFRHLEASYQIAIGNSKEVIMKRLGHIDLVAQESYIHNELKSLFSTS